MVAATRGGTASAPGPARGDGSAVLTSVSLSQFMDEAAGTAGVAPPGKPARDAQNARAMPAPAPPGQAALLRSNSGRSPRRMSLVALGSPKGGVGFLPPGAAKRENAPTSSVRGSPRPDAATATPPSASSAPHVSLKALLGDSARAASGSAAAAATPPPTATASGAAPAKAKAKHAGAVLRDAGACHREADALIRSLATTPPREGSAMEGRVRSGLSSLRRIEAQRTQLASAAAHLEGGVTRLRTLVSEVAEARAVDAHARNERTRGVVRRLRANGALLKAELGLILRSYAVDPSDVTQFKNAMDDFVEGVAGDLEAGC